MASFIYPCDTFDVSLFFTPFLSKVFFKNFSVAMSMIWNLLFSQIGESQFYSGNFISYLKVLLHDIFLKNAF